MRLAYIAQGKLTLLDDKQPPRLIESRFAQDFINRSVQASQRRAWRTSGGGNGMWRNANLWNAKQDFDPRAVKISFSDVSLGEGDDRILYCLQTENVCGLFSYHLGDDQETRLFHKNDFQLGDIRRHPLRNTVVGSLHKEDGTSNLVLFDDDSPHYREITEGDSRDETPHWDAGGNRLVYQSSGVARNAHGYCVGYGPAQLMQLDMRSGELHCIAEDKRHDLLQPRLAADGGLYYLHRPWQAEPWRQGYLWRALKDFVLFPFRLGRAFIDYLNVFSMMYSQKPLKTAGGPPGTEQDVRHAMLHGRVLNVQRALQRYQSQGDAPALVPKNWTLRHRAADGSERIVVAGVSAFDVSADGDIYYTNGTGLFRMAAGQANAERIGRDWLVEKVIAL